VEVQMVTLGAKEGVVMLAAFSSGPAAPPSS